jgi:hypothetical protein
MNNIVAQKTNNATSEFSVTGQWIPEKGEQVKALTASGAFIVRRVWEVGERVIYLCTDRLFGELQTGARLKPAIGFPKQDVYRYEDLKSGK